MKDSTKGINQKIIELQQLKNNQIQYQTKEIIDTHGHSAFSTSTYEENKIEDKQSEYHDKDPYSFSKNNAFRDPVHQQ